VSALVAAELVKLRTTRAWMGYLAAAVLLTGLGAAGRLGSAQRIELGTQAFQRNLLSHSLVSGLLALVVGVVIVTVEWRHGTITRTFLVTPRRERVLLAKAAVAALAGAILALVSVAVVLAVAVPWLAADGATLRVLGLAPVVGRVVLAAALWGLLGAALGAVVQSQAVGLVLAILGVLIVEPLLGALLVLLGLDRAADFLPARALEALESTGDAGISPAGGAAVGLAYAVIVGALGCVRVLRRDLT